MQHYAFALGREDLDQSSAPLVRASFVVNVNVAAAEEIRAVGAG